MIHPNANDTLTVRSVFVIGPDNKVKLTLTYPASTGRNFDELLRVIDSLQLTAKHKVATPADWKQGEDVIIVPAVSDEDAKAAFPNGWEPRSPTCGSPSSPAEPSASGRRAARPSATAEAPGATRCRDSPSSVEAAIRLGRRAPRRRPPPGPTPPSRRPGATSAWRHAVLGGVGGRPHLVERGDGARRRRPGGRGPGRGRSRR